MEFACLFMLDFVAIQAQTLRHSNGSPMPFCEERHIGRNLLAISNQGKQFNIAPLMEDITFLGERFIHSNVGGWVVERTY